jgi:ATP-binding cassette subfamily B protein
MDQQEGFHISNILKLSGKLKPYFPRMIVTVFSGIMNHFLAISVFVMSGYIVGQALVGTLNEKIIPLLIALILLVILRTVFYYSEMWLAHEIAFRVLADFRIKILSSIERVSPSILLGMRSGQLASTLMNDVELLEWFFAHSFGSTIVAFIVTFVILIGLGFFHIAIPLVMLVFLAILFSIPLIMHKKASQQGRLVRDDLADANSVTIEGVQGLREILMLNYVDAYRKINKKSMQKMYDSQLKYGKRLGTEGALLQLVSGLSMIVVLGLTAHLVISGQLDFAWYTVVVILAGMAFNPVIELCNTVRNFGLIFAAANRVFKVIEAKTPVEDNGKNIDVDSLQKDISFDNVYFRYNDDANHALNGVSFTVEQGETVALVGSSGAGKTTCTNLLLRYWDVESGSIRIGGHDIRGMSLDNLRNLTSAVLQDVFLFHGTLKENILLGNPDASEEEMIQAAKAALIHDFIVSLPQGYETMAGERGLRLSGGQRQRIAIARAILKGSPILILDEAVSSLDAENEAEIQKVLDQSRDRRTTLIVAHRLSTIMSADKLVVLKDGGVVQVGTHDELMKSDGFYKSLIETQLHLEVTL